MAMDNQSKWFVITISAVFLIGFLGGYFVNQIPSANSLTGAVVVQTGQSNDIGSQQRGNPNYGALTGTMTFVINSSTGAIISSEAGSNYVLYFSRHGISDWNLVKTDSESYSGTLSNVDADGSGSVCSAHDFTTQRKYYDENNNNVVDPSEFYIYAITTDANGCFAIKAPPGSYDIYG